MTTVNLLRPRLPSPGMVVRRRLAWAAALLLVALFASLTASLWLLTDRRIMGRELSAVKAQLAAEGRHAEQAQALAAAAREADLRTELLALVPEPDERLAELEQAVTAAQPDGCTVGQVTVEPSGVLVVTGTADSHGTVAAFLDRLRMVPALAGVRFQSSVRSREGGAANFSLRGALAGAESPGAEGGDAE